MHIAIFLDQHPRSLGGIQTSVLLQKRFLERAGHRVTIICPSSSKGRATDGYWLLPTWPLTLGGEYGFVANIRRSRKRLDRGFDELVDKFDVVHIQADFWGGIIGLGFALRHRLPIVQTMHFNMSQVTEQLIGKWPARYLFWLLSRELLKHVNRPRSKTPGDPWNYMRLLAQEAAVLFAPSHHFANDLRKHEVAARVEVMHNGIDDDIVHAIVRTKKSKDAVKRRERPLLIWAGRLQVEKRPLEFVRAVALANVDADIEMYGTGGLQKKVRSLISELKLQDQIKLKGKVTYRTMLKAFADADALVQTSVGFETQGMTVYEAAAVGTPSVLCDRNIAKELGSKQHWVVPDESEDALAKTLQRAISDLNKSDERSAALLKESQFLQTQATKQMLKFYNSVIRHHKSPKY